MDILKRLGDYLEDRSGSGEEPEVSLESVVMRGEKHLRRQRWISAAAGAGGMLVFVLIASVAFNADQAPTTDLADTSDGAVAALSDESLDSPATTGPSAASPAQTRTGAFSGEAGVLESTDAGFGFGGPGFEPPVLEATSLATDPLSVTWESSDSGLGWSQHVVESEGLFYALSTAPGVTYEDYDGGHLEQAVYVSSDGLNWEARTFDGGFISDLAVNDGTLYALSTAPGTAQSSLRIGRSDDGGSSWTFSEMPLTAAAPTGLGRVQGSHTETRLAAGDAGVVALVNTSYYVDFWGVIPLELHDRTKERWPEATDEGVVLRDYTLNMEAEMACEEAMRAAGNQDFESEEDYPEPCRLLWGDGETQGEIVYSVSWEELGLTGNPSSRSEIFYSADGVSFERIESPMGSLGYISIFEATGDGFMAIQQSHNTGALTLWSSSNGRDWSQQSTLPNTGWIVSAGVIPGGVAIVGEVHTETGSITVVSTSTDGGQTWRSIGTPETGTESEEHYISGATVGSFGAIVARTAWSYDETTESGGSQTTTLYVTEDYETWSVIPLEDLVGSGQYDIFGLAASGDRVRFDVNEWSNDGRVQTSSFAGVIGG